LSLHLEYRACSHTVDNDVIENIYEFALRNILNQNKHKKVKDYLLFSNEGEKTEKKTEKRQKIVKTPPEWMIAMETSITIDVSLTQENFP